MLAAGFDLTAAEWQVLSKILYDETTGDITTEGDVSCVDVTVSGVINVGTYIKVRSDRVSFGDLGFGAISSPVYGDVWYDSTEGGLMTRSSLGGSGNRAISHANSVFAGDVSGSIGAIIVTGLQGDPVDSTNPVTDEKLVWNGSQWNGTATSRVRAYLSSTQEAAGSWAKLLFNTESYDTRSEYDNSTNYRFTATDAGYYLVISQIYFDNMGDNEWTQLAIRVNNSPVTYAKYTQNVTNSEGAQVLTDVIYLTASQYVEIWAINGSPGDYIGGSQYSYLCVHKMI